MKLLLDKDWEDFNNLDEKPIAKEQEEFANELFNFLEQLRSFAWGHENE